MQFELTPFALPPDYAAGIVSLADMKAHLRVLHDDEDDLIGICRDAAVDMVERYCGLRLDVCEDLVWRGEELAPKVKLGVFPVTALTSITWLDQQGESVSGDVSIWRIVRRGVIGLKPGATLPDTVGGGVEVTFTAGFTAANRPAMLVQAVKMFAAHLFEHREAVMAGTVAGEVPLGFKQICGQFRVPVL